MMGITLEARTGSMLFLFKSKKTKETEKKNAATDKKIEAIKANTMEKAQTATDAVAELNKLVEKHGISGLIYFSTGKGRKK